MLPICHKISFFSFLLCNCFWVRYIFLLILPWGTTVMRIRFRFLVYSTCSSISMHLPVSNLFSLLFHQTVASPSWSILFFTRSPHSFFLIFLSHFPYPSPFFNSLPFLVKFNMSDLWSAEATGGNQHSVFHTFASSPTICPSTDPACKLLCAHTSYKTLCSSFCVKSLLLSSSSSLLPSLSPSLLSVRINRSSSPLSPFY